MRHKLEIGVLKGEPRDMVAGCRKARLGKRLADRLFGSRGKVAIIVPGDSVGEVAITEVEGERRGKAMGRMSDLDISRREPGQVGAEAEIYEGISQAFAKLPALKRGSGKSESPDLLTDSYETDESIEAKKAAGADFEAEVEAQRTGIAIAKAKAERKEAKAEGPTLEDTRAVLTSYARKGFTKDIRDIIVGHGANKLSGLKPERYAEVLERMRDIANGRH